MNVSMAGLSSRNKFLPLPLHVPCISCQPVDFILTEIITSQEDTVVLIQRWLNETAFSFCDHVLCK